MIDAVLIPPGACVGVAGEFALTQRGVRALLARQIETDTQHAIAIAQCSGDRRVVEAQRDSYQKAADSAGWWKRWAPLLIVFGTAASALGGFVAGVALGGR